MNTEAERLQPSGEALESHSVETLATVTNNSQVQQPNNAVKTRLRKGRKTSKHVKTWTIYAFGKASLKTVLGVPVGGSADLKVGGAKSEEGASEDAR